MTVLLLKHIEHCSLQRVIIPVYVGTEPIIADYNYCLALKVNWPAIFPRFSQLIAKQNASLSPLLHFWLFDLSMWLIYFHSSLLFTFHTPLYKIPISFFFPSLSPPHSPLLSISVRLSLWGHVEGNRDIWASGKQMWAFESKRRAAKEIKDLETLSLSLPSHTQQRGVTLLRFLRRHACESGWCCHMVVMKSSRTLMLWKHCREKFGVSFFSKHCWRTQLVVNQACDKLEWYFKVVFDLVWKCWQGV